MNIGRGCGFIGECGYSIVGTWYELWIEVRRGQSKKWSTVRGRSFLQWGHECGKR